MTINSNKADNSDKGTAELSRANKQRHSSNCERQDKSISNHVLTVSKLPKTFTKEEIEQMATHNKKKLPTYINPPIYNQPFKKKVSIAEETFQANVAACKDSMESLDKPSSIENHNGKYKSIIPLKSSTKHKRRIIWTSDLLAYC